MLPFERMRLERGLQVCVVGALVALAVVAAMFASPAAPVVGSPASHAAFPGRNGALVFENRGYPWLINPDASGRLRVRMKRVTYSTPAVQTLAMSPDGKTIAFVQQTERDGKLYTIPAYRPAGQRFVRARLVTRDAPQLIQGGGRFTSGISWSPDGRQIVFQRENELVAIRRDGTGVRRILRIRPNTRIGGSELYFGTADPAWSPDGRRIAFAGVPAGLGASACSSIITARTDGGDERRVTPAQPVDATFGMSCPNLESSPSWSPDGRRIAFIRQAGRGKGGDVWVVNANGGGETRIAERKSSIVGWGQVVWSPDGKKVVATLGGGIWVMNPDGSGKRRVMIGNGRVEIAGDIDWQRCLPRQRCGVPRGSR